MNFTVTPGFQECHRADVAVLFWQAFGAKLTPSLGSDERALMFIERALRSDFAFTAVAEDGRLLGAAGIKTDKGGFLTAQYKDLRTVYGVIGAVWRGVILDQFERPVQPGILQMDGIFVDASARGLGVGTKLLDAIIWTARMNRCTAVRLDVVEDNPRARALYERYGFKPTGEVNSGVMAPLMGFRSATTMMLPVS